MSKTNSLGYITWPISAPSVKTDTLTANDTLIVDNVNVSTAVTTLESKVQALEGKNGGGSIDGPIDFTLQNTTQYAYFADGPRSTQATQFASSYQIVGNRITVFGQFLIQEVTGMNYCESFIPFPVVDGKTYGMNTDITDYPFKIQVTGGFGLGTDWIFPGHIETRDGIGFVIPWTKADSSVWTGAATGNIVPAAFGATYIYTIV